MYNLLQSIFFLGLIVAFIIFVGFLLIQISKLKSKSIIRQINAGKMSDKKLIRLYKNNKKWKDSKFAAILSVGIYYKFWIKQQNILHEAYKQGMIKRNLPL